MEVVELRREVVRYSGLQQGPELLLAWHLHSREMHWMWLEVRETILAAVVRPSSVPVRVAGRVLVPLAPRLLGFRQAESSGCPAEVFASHAAARLPRVPGVQRQRQ